MITNKKTKADKEIFDKEEFDQERLFKIVCANNYSEFPNDPYEPSNTLTIKAEKLNYNKLTEYLSHNYKIGSKPEHQLNAIKAIIDIPMLQVAIQLNKSEYFKILTHFGILSKIQQGWYNLFITAPLRVTKPSLSDHPTRFAIQEKKKLHDAIIRCYYYRLINGMSEKDKDRYPYLLPIQTYLTGFDLLLLKLDKAIQILFTKVHRGIDGYNDEKNSPDFGLDEAVCITRSAIKNIIDKHVKNNISESLRVLLIKMASLNRAINDIDAIIAIQDQILDSLPKNIESLCRVRYENEILPAIVSLQGIGPGKFPKDLIKHAKVVCKLYIISSNDHCFNKKELDDFEERHMQSDCIAVAALLLYNDFCMHNKLRLNIAGETNPKCSIYKEVSKLSNKIDDVNDVSANLICNYSINQELIKFIVTRHSIAINSLSNYYSSKVSAAAQIKVRRAKLEIQREMYEIFKIISIKDALSIINEFYDGHQ